MQRLLCVWGNPPCVNTIWNALRVALRIISGKIIFISGFRNACGRFWTPFSQVGFGYELLGKVASPQAMTEEFSPPRRCFRRKPAWQLPVAVTLLIRENGIAERPQAFRYPENKNNSSAAYAQSARGAHSKLSRLARRAFFLSFFIQFGEVVLLLLGRK